MLRHFISDECVSFVTDRRRIRKSSFENLLTVINWFVVVILITILNSIILITIFLGHTIMSFSSDRTKD